MKKVKSGIASKGKKKEKKELKKKDKGIFLKGDKVKGYILVQDDGVCYQDMALTSNEIDQLFVMLKVRNRLKKRVKKFK